MEKNGTMNQVCRMLISLLFVLIIILPISILIYGSFQGGGIQNYIDILTKYHIQTYFLNSVLISVMVVFTVVLLDILAGFAFSKMQFPFKNALYLFLLAALLLPSAAILVPIFQINSKIGLINSYLSVLGPYVVLIAPFNLLTIKNGFDAMPNTVLEAGMIDGCSVWKTLWRIAVPMNRPAIMMAVIWTFISSWNEYLFAFVMLRKEEMMTITVIPTKFQSMYGGRMGMLYAALFLILIPSIIIYFVLQKFIVGGLNAGAVKE
ncbi:MAG: carbohydrate ABC transporter permease [Lachnospiraceae bacterium]